MIAADNGIVTALKNSIDMAEKVRELWECELSERIPILDRYAVSKINGTVPSKDMILPAGLEIVGMPIVSAGDIPLLEFIELAGRLMVRRAEAARILTVAKLSPSVRQVMMMRYVQFLRWHAIAEAMSRSVRWVYSQRDKAFAILRLE